MLFSSKKNRNNYIIVDKQALELRVYDGDNLIAVYPVCVGKNLGQKERKGDMKTPECTMEQPFHITQIQWASWWKHDFGDGRGSIRAYGRWFMRLDTPGHQGIGIHGSTNNEDTVPGRSSEGCVRMHDRDLVELKRKYAFVGMKVVILKDIVADS